MNLTAIFLGPAVIAGMTALLGLLIAAVDMVVNNYGEVKININGGKSISLPLFPSGKHCKNLFLAFLSLNIKKLHLINY